MNDISIRFAGMGGQGIIFSGITLARAFALYERRNGKELYASQTQSYGPEARGGASRCDVRVSESEVFYPFVEVPDYLVIMSQQAYDKYINIVHPQTLVLLDQESVEGKPELRFYEIPATRKAEEIGMQIVANVIMLGAFVEVSEIISNDAVIRALNEVSPEGTVEMNLKAFKLGNALGREVLKEGEE